MSRFPLVRETNDAQLQSMYKEMVGMGMVGAIPGKPFNGFTSMGERPDLMSGFWEFTKGAIVGGTLPPTVKQMVCMTIAMQNNCRYCTVAHTGALQAMGVPDEVIKSCAADPELSEVPPPQRAMILFALKLARDPQSLSDEDFKNLRSFGLSDGEIMELIMVSTWATAINIWTDASQVPVDGQEEG